MENTHSGKSPVMHGANTVEWLPQLGEKKLCRTAGITTGDL